MLSSQARDSDNLAHSFPQRFRLFLCGRVANRATALAPHQRGAHFSGASMNKDDDIEWRVSDAPVPYEEALALHGGARRRDSRGHGG